MTISIQAQKQKYFQELDVDNVFKSIYTTIITKMQKSLGKGADSIIDWIIYHTISISKYNPLQLEAVI